MTILAVSPGPGFAQSSDGDDLLDDLGGAAEDPTAEPAPNIEDVDIDGDLEEPEDSKKDEPAPAAAQPVAAEAAGAPADTSSAAESSSAGPPSTVAPERTEPIVDRVKAVQKKPVLKRARVELSPYSAIGVNDPFYTHVAFGGGLTFFPHDNFGLGLSLTYFVAHQKTLAHEVVRIGQKSVPAEFDLPKYFVGVDLHWIPIYGKVSLFNSVIAPFDLYLIAGGGIVNTGVNSRLSANIGIGQRFFVGDFLALRIELRDHMYLDTLRVDGQLRSDIQNYILLQLGVSLFVPPSFEYGT